MIEIPNYEIGKLAGRGGVAEVYLATHKLLDRTVAIKLISPTKAGDLADKRFLKEAKVLAGLRHPNIVSIYDVGVLENKYYIIMEFLEGGDLKQHIKKGVSPARSVEILKQMGSALAHAHDKGFIHRDIKSQNIMFRSDGTAVLTDFGIVKDLTADSGYTLDGTSIGTPHYMSPEQAQGSSKIDYRTDLYSLGVTFYEMLTGSVPYQADSPVAVALKHIKDPVPRLPEHLSRYQTIIDRLMAKKPDKRFQSAHELIKVLDKLDHWVSGDTPTETIEYTARTALKPRKSRILVRPGFLIAAIGIAGVLAGLLIFAPPYISNLMDSRPMDQAESIEATASSSSGDASEPSAESAKPKPSPEKARQEPKTAAGSSSAPEEPETAADGAFESEPLTRAIANRNYSAALNQIQELRSELSVPEDGMLQKADNFLAAGQSVNAADVYNTLLSVDSQNKAAALGLLQIAVDKQQSLENQTSPSPDAFAAHLAFLEKGVENTGSPLFKHLKVNTVETIHETGQAQFEENALSAALETAETGLKYAPDHLRLKKLRLRALARISFNDRRLTIPDGDNALTYYQELLALDPKDADARRGLEDIVDWFKSAAETAYKNENYDQAVDYIEKAGDIGHQDKAVKHLEWRIRADMHYAAGNYATPEDRNARVFYQKVMAADPEDGKAALRLDKIDVLAPLAQAAGDGAPLSEKIALYRDAFQSLKAATAAHGSEATADLKAAVKYQIKQTIENQKRQLAVMPDAFINLVTSHFPDFDHIFHAQYDILIAKGDRQNNPADRAAFYVDALKLNPARTSAKKKIATVADELENAGKPNEAVSILDQAMGVVPDDAGLKQLYSDIKRVRDVKAELFTELYQIKVMQPFQKKIDPYGRLFEKLEAAIAEYGREKMAGPRQEMAEQLKADIKASRSKSRIMPERFMNLVAAHFPEIKKQMHNAQYDILMEKAETNFSIDQKSDYLLRALGLQTGRPEVTERITDLVKNVNSNGQYEKAVAILKQAKEKTPEDSRIAELYQQIHREVEVFPTLADCSREHSLSEAPVTRESLNLCIHYRNLSADSIVNVRLAHSGGQSMEVPVVLSGSSGSKPISVAAPIEGFTVGEYAIIVEKDTTTLSESRIKFVPKRRE
jgi:serine/threonine protein kinase